jgi:serine/threonine protein kinase
MYTKGVVTLYYRPPEILMGMPYDQKADTWSLGCIFAELINGGKALMPGKNVEHQFELMCSVLGFPEVEDWPEVYEEQEEHIARLAKYNFYSKNRVKDYFQNISEQGQDFLSRLLQWDPKVSIPISI